MEDNIYLPKYHLADKANSQNNIVFDGLGSYDKTLSYIFFKGLNKLIPAKALDLPDLSLVKTLTTRLII